MKQKKKRTKKYSGTDSKIHRPSVTRVQAVSRQPIQQWLFERKKLLSYVGSIVVILFFVVLIISGILSLF